MKVILLKDVPKLGRKDEVKEVSQGHAINFLIPRKLVVAATPSLLAQLEKKKQEVAAHQAAADAKVKELLNQIAGSRIVVTEKATPQGHLFSKVAAKEIAAAIVQATGAPVDSTWIQIPEPIKSVGEHAVTIMRGTHHATVTVEVVTA
ncbi:MAG: hypothetical protein RL150_402 [Candidatus Parcubacteria bacterium]|jgi:large subunit ribosomal protein L9